MRLKSILAVILLLSLPVCSSAGDNFIYGVQVYNRPVDWDQGGSERLQELINYAVSLDVDMIRGGSQFDNMSAQARENNNAGVLRGMNTLLPMIRQNNIILDWVLVGTLSEDSDSSLLSPARQTGEIYSIPPMLNRWREVVRLGAELAGRNSADVIYEIWNEPDLPQFWRGTRPYYYNIMIPEAAAVIHAVNPSSRIINGGLVLGNSDSEADDYMNEAVKSLNDGKISMLAIHSHNTLNEFLRLWHELNLQAKSVDISKVILNESGSALDTEGGTVIDTPERKAYHSIGKVLAAKRLGLGGISVFHLGGLDMKLNSDLLEQNKYDYSMIDLVNGELVPNKIYYALKTAIKFTKGLSPVSSETWPEASNNIGYIWLFRNDDGTKKTLAVIGRRPSALELSDAFGTETPDEYDMFGERIITATNSTGQYEISYFVSGFEPESLDVPAVVISDDIDSGVLGESYDIELSSDVEGVTWHLVSEDELPEGLSLDSDTGHIWGNPLEFGSFDVNVYAEKDGISSDVTTITLNIEAVGKLTIKTTQESLDQRTYYTGVNYVIGFSSEPSAAEWSIISGDIPSGMDFMTGGYINGRPDRAGEYNFILLAERDNYEPASADFRLVILSQDISGAPVSDDENSSGSSGSSNDLSGDISADVVSSDDKNPGHSSGGGGCDSGLGVIAGVMVLMFLRRR